MQATRNLTRQKLIYAAIELFSAQGVSETTTKQIAEAAGVNEVTLFRQFGNKHGLLLAVIEESAVFSQLGQNLVGKLPPVSNLAQMLREYASTCLQALEQTPAVVRSLVGESAQYSIENRQALGRSFDRANRRVAKYLKTASGESAANLDLPIEELASLLHTLLFGYATIELTSEFHGLWDDRDDFLDRVVGLLLPIQCDRSAPPTSENRAKSYPDLAETVVHQILQLAKKDSLQTYAIVYVLFGSGLSPAELTRLKRTDLINTRDRQILQITDGLIRQVPLNRSIMGKSYGSYLKNPLTQWLKNRQDAHLCLFLNPDGSPLTETDLRQQWQELTQQLTTPIEIEQTQSTWCVEMLMRGLTTDTIQLLTGWEIHRLDYYRHRAKEQTALLEAFALDRG